MTEITLEEEFEILGGFEPMGPEAPIPYPNGDALALIEWIRLQIENSKDL